MLQLPMSTLTSSWLETFSNYFRENKNVRPLSTTVRLRIKVFSFHIVRGASLFSNKHVRLQPLKNEWVEI